jgi:GT2 family glycosyltransferase
MVGGPVRPIWPTGEPEWLHPWQRGFFTIVDYGGDERALGTEEWLAGTNIAFRREPLLEAGGFSEALGRTGSVLLSNEELNLTERIRERGLESYYNPSAEVFHRVHADRVNRSWMRRRVAWQAVSDLLAGKNSGDADQHWRRLAKYFLAMPPEMRTVRGLFLDTADPAVFQKQCDALESVLHLALACGDDPLGDRKT